MEAVGLLRAEVLSAATSRAAAIGRADLTGVLVPEFRGRPHRRGRRPQPGPDRPARPAPIGGLPRKIAAGEQGLLRIWPTLNKIAFRGCVRWKLREAWHRRLFSECLVAFPGIDIMMARSHEV